MVSVYGNKQMPRLEFLLPFGAKMTLKVVLISQ